VQRNELNKKCIHEPGLDAQVEVTLRHNKIIQVDDYGTIESLLYRYVSGGASSFSRTQKDNLPDELQDWFMKPNFRLRATFTLSRNGDIQKQFCVPILQREYHHSWIVFNV